MTVLGYIGIALLAIVAAALLYGVVRLVINPDEVDDW